MNPSAPHFSDSVYDPYGRDRDNGNSLNIPGDIPAPPNLHWALVLLFTALTGGLFLYVWMLVQAAWVRKLDPTARSLKLTIAFIAICLLESFVDSRPGTRLIVELLLVIAMFVLFVWAIFSMRASLLEYFNDIAPIDLELSGLLTFFFTVFYFQYHMSRIARWKKEGGRRPS